VHGQVQSTVVLPLTLVLGALPLADGVAGESLALHLSVSASAAATALGFVAATGRALTAAEVSDLATGSVRLMPSEAAVAREQGEAPSRIVADIILRGTVPVTRLPVDVLVTSAHGCWRAVLLVTLSFAPPDGVLSFPACLGHTDSQVLRLDHPHPPPPWAPSEAYTARVLMDTEVGTPGTLFRVRPARGFFSPDGSAELAVDCETRAYPCRSARLVVESAGFVWLFTLTSAPRVRKLRGALEADK
jgi:hypothetical protein